MYRIIGGDQKEYGPVTVEEIRRWIAEGRLNAQSRARPESGGDWQPLASFPEFDDALRTQAGSAVPPPGMPMPSASAELWTAQMLAGRPRLRVGQSLRLSWKLLTENFGLLFGATALVWLIATLSAVLPFGGLLYMLLKGVLYGGLYLVFLKVIRGQPAAVADTFGGFNIAFAQLMLAGFITSLLSGIGFVCCIIPGLYLFVAWTFAVPLVADRRLEFWAAMELSRKIVSRVWFEMFGLVVLAFLPTILMHIFVQGKISMNILPFIQEAMKSSHPDFVHLFSLALQIAKSNLILILSVKVVGLLNLPFAVGALMYAYEDLFGTRSTPTT